MNYPELIEILEKIESLVTESSNVNNTIYSNANELLDDLDAYISELLENSGSWIQYLDMHFKKNGTFQTVAQQNNWEAAYKDLLERYNTAKNK